MENEVTVFSDLRNRQDKLAFTQNLSFLWKRPYLVSSSISSNKSSQPRICEETVVCKSETESFEPTNLSEELENKNLTIEILEKDLQVKENEVKELLDGILQIHNKNKALEVGFLHQIMIYFFKTSKCTPCIRGNNLYFYILCIFINVVKAFSSVFY